MWSGYSRSTPVTSSAGSRQMIDGGQADGHGSGRGDPAEGLLDARQLLLGLAGQCRGGSPLIGWARELADLHTTLVASSISAPRRPDDFDVADTRDHIGAISILIDEWSVLHLPRPRGARRHTHSLGEVISHVAETYARVQWILCHDN